MEGNELHWSWFAYLAASRDQNGLWKEHEVESGVTGATLLQWWDRQGVSEPVRSSIIDAGCLVDLENLEMRGAVEASKRYVASNRIGDGAAVTKRALNAWARSAVNMESWLPTTGNETSELMGDIAAELYREVLDEHQRQVDYGKVKGGRAWKRFIQLSSALPFVEPGDMVAMCKEKKKAFWINLYNLMVVHGKLEFGHPTSARSKGLFFSHQVIYNVAGHGISLGEIEHAILRCQMGPDDPRFKAYSVHVRDPRIHFLLNCGAQSCPPYRAILAKEVEAQIAEAAARLIAMNDYVEVISKERSFRGVKRLYVTRLFKWFRQDFTPNSRNNADLFHAILALADEQRRRQLHNQLQISSGSERIRIKFKKYNWADNSDFSLAPEVGGMFIYDISFALSGGATYEDEAPSDADDVCD
mmetsp:Transcript_1765/g.3232  ORF Transcript_1765/g.3232 Transcript_1765/m.3232 type:complete len:415 (-) Transcript_1765:561-1805(-)